MSWIEILGVALQLITVLLLSVGFIATVRQIKLLHNVHIDNHEWNRRKAAQDVTLTYKQVVSTKNLQQHFDYVNNTTKRIPIEVVEKEFLDNAELKSDIHRLLDYFDALCRGVNHAVYDEEIIKTSWSGVITRTFDQFSPYIDWYRKDVNPKGWFETEILIDKWKHEDMKNESRKPTGV